MLKAYMDFTQLLLGWSVMDLLMYYQVIVRLK